MLYIIPKLDICGIGIYLRELNFWMLQISVASYMKIKYISDFVDAASQTIGRELAQNHQYHVASSAMGG